MNNFLEFTTGKFIFKTAVDRLYTEEGLWVKWDGVNAQVGLSDFTQQRGGDVAFADVVPAGSIIKAGSGIATLETIKVNTEFSFPMNGVVMEANPRLETTPEVINQDPYGEGWLAFIRVEKKEFNPALLLTPEKYHELVKRTAEEDAGS